LNDAGKTAVSLIQQFPNDQFSWKVLGVILKQLGKLPEALLVTKQAIKLNLKDFKAYNNLGLIFEDLGHLEDALVSFQKAISLNNNYAEAYNNMANIQKKLSNIEEAERNFRKAIMLKPDLAEAYTNLGNILKTLNKFQESEKKHKQAIKLKPNYADAYNNLGQTQRILGKLEDAEASYRKAIQLNPKYAEFYGNMGVVLEALTKSSEAELSYKKAISLKPDISDFYWNLSGSIKSISDAEYWINKCLKIDKNHVKAKLIKAVLNFYQGDKTDFKKLMQSELRQHYFMSSLIWSFSLANLPNLHFNKWSFFDDIIDQSIKSRPFYEFGVFKGHSFKYFMKFFKKGYGFDTFNGLPEDWIVGNRIEKASSYSADGNIPEINGGVFFKGKFEDTLPLFYSKPCPLASVINFDADLYSSTICALDYSRSVIDKNTILIFDEFIMYEKWKEHEFKALEEFVFKNKCTYEVIAISFFTKQVAVKIIGI
jgi:Flp pilus assembly protein TadD